jgi:FAD dependent oxidoreductase
VTDFEVCVLGGGIAGCITACLLADEGRSVAIVEQRDQLMDGASRWNDGKIHLGYTFTGTPSVATATLMQEGAGVFIPILERVIGEAIKPEWFGRGVDYVVDRDSLFDAETLWQRAQAVAQLLRESSGRTPGLRHWLAPALMERLDPASDLGPAAPNAVGAWRTTERHISSRLVATALRAAVAARPIVVVHDRVGQVSNEDGAWNVRLDSGQQLSASAVVNCLWEDLPRVDRQVAATASDEPPYVIRFKFALFGTNTGLQDYPSSTRILGKYGDIASYGNDDAYLSWYPACLASRSDDGLPPSVPAVDEAAMTKQILAGLNLPSSTLEHPGAQWNVRGGYVVARGSGDIDKRGSLLHTRDLPRAAELRPGFVSVDTGKYTLGPMLAAQAAELATRRLSQRPAA